ncbi:MAG: CdaR family protein, partial [Synergistota bacterium]|nr:CdaR family protein [Synergistota bacterium]
MIRHIDRLLASKTFLKIVSVLVASFLWYYVAADRSTEVVRSYRVPLEYLNAPADLSISVDMREVDVQVAGNRDVIGKKGPESITCQVDLANLEAGIHYVPVQIFTPSGLRLIEVAPSTIQMELVRMATKSVPVGLEVVSGLPPGYRLESVRFEPDTVILKGAENDLASINRALVSPTLEQL